MTATSASAIVSPVSSVRFGGVLHRVTERQLDALPVREHVRAYMREAFALAERSTGRRLGSVSRASSCS